LVNFLSRNSRATGPKHARSHGLAGIVDKHRGVVVKRMYVPSLRRASLRMPDDDALHDFAFLDLAFRRRFLHGSGDDIPETRFQAGIAADGHDAHQLACAGVIGNRQQVRI